MCKSEKQITFCTCQNEPKKVVHHKKSKRWQDKNPVPVAYVWTLSKFVKYFESMMEGQMEPPSDNLGEELASEFVLQELNSRNCFDFDYVPNEGDCLSVRKNRDWTFFSFIFREGVWEVGQYSCFYVITEKIDSGKLEIQDNFREGE